MVKPWQLKAVKGAKQIAICSLCRLKVNKMCIIAFPNSCAQQEKYWGYDQVIFNLSRQIIYDFTLKFQKYFSKKI